MHSLSCVMQLNYLLLLSGGWTDSHLSYSMPGTVGSSGMPRISQAGSNVVDNNNFLGHEVGAWKGSEASWRGDDLNRTLTPQPADSGAGLVQGIPQGSFRIVDSDLSFAAGDRSWKTPAHDEMFQNGRVPQAYDSSQQQGFGDIRSSEGRAMVGDQSQRPGRLVNGTGGRYPAMPNTRPLDIAAGLSLTFLKLLAVEFCFIFTCSTLYLFLQLVVVVGCFKSFVVVLFVLKDVATVDLLSVFQFCAKFPKYWQLTVLFITKY